MQHSKILYEKGYIQNLKMLTQSQLSQIKFIARLQNIKSFIGPLKAINFDETATFQISENGLRIVVENSKSVQAILYITRDCFEEYKIPPEETIIFAVNLNLVTECLSIFSGVECSMKMIYKGQGAPLVLVLEHHGEDDIITECSIKTKNHEENIDYEIDEDNSCYNSIIIRGPDFSNLLSEIDKSADEIEIFLSPNSPYFRISTIGVMQSESNIEVAKTSDMIITFSCKDKTVSRYKLSNIRLIMKALFLATKISIRTDSTGLLALQLMILSTGASQVYIEFYITPLVDFE